MARLTEDTAQDAPASVDTTYSIAVGDSFEGIATEQSDEDWIWG